MPPTSKGVIQVYTRKGAREDERLISWNPPPEMRKAEVLQLGYAIERDSARLAVTARPRFGDPNDPEAWKGPILPLQEALNQAQKALQDWLEAKGYSVEFK